jgi:hypothetical protein
MVKRYYSRKRLKANNLKLEIQEIQILCGADTYKNEKNEGK